MIMRNVLLMSVALLALTGCNTGNATNLPCSGQDAILKEIEAGKGVNLLSVDSIVTKDHADNSTKCEATLHTQSTYFDNVPRNTFRVVYSVSLTDDGKQGVQIEDCLYSSEVENEADNQAIQAATDALVARSKALDEQLKAQRAEELKAAEAANELEKNH